MEQFTIDSPPSKSPLSVPRQTSTLVVEIPIPAFPKYIPGSGPPLEELSILPPDDSTAYIIDKVLLPSGNAADGKPRPKCMAWVVSWSDYPEVRRPIRATEIYDYVSPRTLEDFEYKAWQTRKEKLRREEEEKRQRLTTRVGRPILDVQVPRRRGPPPRAHTQLPGVPEVPVEKEMKPTKRNASGMLGPSLSTPQKRRLEEFEELELGIRDTERDTEDEFAMMRFPNGVEMDIDAMNTGEESSARGMSRSRTPAGAPPILSKLSAASSPAPSMSALRVASIKPPNGELQSSPSPAPISFTPVAQSTAKRKAVTPIKRGTPPLSTMDDSRRPKKRKDTRKKALTSPDQEWAVERLEDVKYDHAGRRFFLVRWVGDWDPTWEPEENIKSAMVTEFIRKRFKLGLDGARDVIEIKSQPQPQKKYASVSEAFEDALLEAQIEEEMGTARDRDFQGRVDEEAGETLRVTDGAGSGETSDGNGSDEGRRSTGDAVARLLKPNLEELARFARMQTEM